ncbi:transporter, major facilitator family protein [Aeromicrobium marinum DSM 15272]|uniref:Transporter, major facilitator family protein n=1 Tax=Aeromicrobium marinum DSM 15272 TaxID=585531 RepID=E2SB65_9ACTN|nr:MFS transporter [Aeromicrobium marinum]EFQ83611.1 transporter, major facilitator family protein [Aeromicrobium marinum DSM 15272]
MTTDLREFPQARTLSVLSLVQVVGGIGNGAGLAVGALLVKDISGSSGWAGTATVMLTLGAAAATIPLSRLAVRAGRRPALATGWLLGASGAAVTVMAADRASLWLVLLGLLFFGASTAATLQSRFAAVDRAAPSTVGRSLSIVVWSTTVGAVAGPNLTGPGAAVAARVGVPDLAGPMLFSVAAFGLAGMLTLLTLRPDPLVRRTAADRGPRVRALDHLHGPALTAVGAIAASHAVMVGVMSLTPVHLADHGASLQLIGLTISLHIAGMFALSPVFGWLSDRLGPVPMIVAGQIVLVLAVAVAGTAGDSHLWVTIGLVLLGLGWSASVIAGAALLTLVVDAEARPAVQGFADLAMNLAGAGGGLLAGLVMAWSGFGALNAAAAALTLPVAGLVLAGRRAAAELAAADRVA